MNRIREGALAPRLHERSLWCPMQHALARMEVASELCSYDTKPPALVDRPPTCEIRFVWILAARATLLFRGDCWADCDKGVF
jgi:hypothetical protein